MTRTELEAAIAKFVETVDNTDTNEILQKGLDRWVDNFRHHPVPWSLDEIGTVCLELKRIIEAGRALSDFINDGNGGFAPMVLPEKREFIEDLYPEIKDCDEEYWTEKDLIEFYAFLNFGEEVDEETIRRQKATVKIWAERAEQQKGKAA